MCFDPFLMMAFQSVARQILIELFQYLQIMKTAPMNFRILLTLVTWIAIGIVPAQVLLAKSDPTKADVIVYGATPGGVCAAIGAAREGVSVILLEPTAHVGGMNTGGLSHSDSNQCDRSTVMGLFDEWHTRIEKEYQSRGIKLPYQVSVKNHSIWTYEPHVAAKVTQQMLKEANVDVLTNRFLQSVRKQGNRITDLVTTDGTFQAKVFIDATYEGDLLAAAGVGWTIGREGRAEFGESYAGKQYPKRKMKINGFDDQGKLLPLVTATDQGIDRKSYDEAGDENVMVYSFRLCLTEDPANRIPFPEPANYDPARFEIMRRYAKSGGRLGFDLYPLPGKKLDGNNSIGGQFSLGLVGGGKDWCEADQAGRAAIWEAHKQYTLEFYHFLTHDPAVPPKVRQRYARLGLCKDEFSNYEHFSPALYVREGRRMRGMYVLSQKDILEEPEKDDPIIISSFPIDSHDCQRIALSAGGVINEGTIFPVRMKKPKQGYAYHVPYRSILPKPEECTNLLVPVALSCTHVGISSIRVEPTWMILGQSAGIAAALTAANEEVQSVQNLPYPKLRERLLAQGQVLDLPPESTATGKLPSPKQNKQSKNEDQRNPGPLKIINWNVLYGFNHGQAIEQGTQWLNRQSPDVVALQELNGNTAISLREKAKQWGHGHSAILKEKGFPVGLTSNAPIEVIQRQVKGFHHGYLHCKTHDIHFFVVHFWPRKDHEAEAIIERIKPLLAAKQKVMVLGDFNSHSRQDQDFLSQRARVQPLYDVVNKFEKLGFVDVVRKHDRQVLYSFPSPITIPKWSESMEVVKSKRQRIDFVFAGPQIQKRSMSGTILISDELNKISDHYPVIVEFEK